MTTPTGGSYPAPNGKTIYFMNDSAPNEQTPKRIIGISADRLGVILCSLSALLYCSANICIKHLADTSLNKALILTCKESFAALLLLPVILIMLIRGRRIFISWRDLAILAGVAFLVQVVGNRNQIFALGTIGLTIAIPIIFATQLTSSAGMGRAFLGERINARTALAMVVLISSIVLISVTSERPNDNNHINQNTKNAESDEATIAAAGIPGTVPDTIESNTAPPDKITTAMLLIGIAAAITCGITYASLTLTIRYTSTVGNSLFGIMFVTTAMGTVTLLPIGLWQTDFFSTPWPDIGRSLASVPAEDYGWILAAGAFNFIAFICLTSGLSLTHVVRANLLNASQVAVTALAGILFFSEKVTLFLLLGIGLTIVGILLIGGKQAKQDVAPGEI